MLLPKKPHSHSKYSVAGPTQPWGHKESNAETKQNKFLVCLAVTKRLKKGFQMFQARHCGSHMKSEKSSAGVLGQNEIYTCKFKWFQLNLILSFSNTNYPHR